MKGFFGKVGRNVAASVQGSEFEKRLSKATFPLDTKEPKEKHVVFVIECLSGEQSDLITYTDAYALFLKRYNEVKNEKISVAKCYIILHRYLRYNKQYETTSSTEIACYQIASSKLEPYIQQGGSFLFTGLLSAYLDYINKFVETNKQIEFINRKAADAFEKVQDLLVSQLFENFELIATLQNKISMIFQFFGYQASLTEVNLAQDQNYLHK